MLDFRKAFDSLQWPFIQQTLSVFNFGESIKCWISILYAKSEISVSNNGFCTESFPLSRGVRQGCPFSPLLFILGAEILASKIRQDQNIQGIKIHNYEFKISQFSDDTSLLCKDLNSVENAIALLNVFERVSGLRLNQSKTKALWLGPWRFSDSKPFGLKWTKDPVRTLGIFISYDEKGNCKKNITDKIEKMDNRLNFWRSRSLTLLGRCLIFKSLGVPQLIDSASMSSMPMETSVKLITNCLFNFIWHKKT